MVIDGVGLEFPFIDRPAARLGPHAVLGREVLREKSVFLGLRAEQAQAPPVA